MKYFIVEELVPESVFNLIGESALKLMEPSLITFIENMRIHFGKPITINNWKWGGQFSQRGLRTKDSEFYNATSQHSFGKALDFDIEGLTAQEVRDWVIENRKLDWVKPIGFIEDEVNWVHVDIRPTKNSVLLLWHPKTHKIKLYNRE